MDQTLLPHVEAVNAELCKRHLRDFIEQSWHLIEPGTVFIPNWHIDAICDHLEAVTSGEIRHLIINIPPRCMKSIIVSVNWPVWSWIQNPSSKWLFASYSQALSTRDARKSRQILDSGWFASMQNYWGTDIQLSGDQNQKQRYENTEMGYRIATSVDGAATGEGGDFVCCDDPHNVSEGESDPVRQKAVTWWKETMSSRLNDQKTGHKVIIMQRVHEADLTGVCVKEGGYEHLCLPMEFDKKGQCKTSIFMDPRKINNELLWPARIGQAELDGPAGLKKSLGDYGFAGQYNQIPAPRKGGLFQVDEFEIVDMLPANAKIVRSVRSWDKAGTDGGGAYTVGALIHQLEVGTMKKKAYFIEDIVRGQWRAELREERILNTAISDKRKVKIILEQEGGSGGKESVESTTKMLDGFDVDADRPIGDKELRAGPYATQVNTNSFLLQRADWNDEFIHEHRFFPNGTYKDQVDAVAMGHSALVNHVRVYFG